MINDDSLESRLRNDAPPLPAFSPALHQRIVERLAHQPHRRAFWRRALWPVGVAAAAAVIIALWPSPVAHDPPPRPPLARIPSVRFGTSVRPLADADAHLAANQYASLDRDAARLGQFLLRTLPHVPRPPA